MEIKLIIEKSEIKEYLEIGFFQKELRNLDIEISNFSSGNYRDEFYIHLKGNEENLIEFLEFYGYNSEEILEIME
jgi:hypothetical protein